jgi:glycosyltransferase involved in cell wall biosynthesis
MRDYYSEFSRLPAQLVANAWQLDRDSVRHSRACLFPTEWAASSAIRDYGAEPSQVHVIPWGANIDADEHSDYQPMISRDVCHLVFIGVDWQRKGGDIAVAAARRLVDLGYKVKLHIIGATPNLREHADSIIVHGFIDKRTEEGRRLFRSLMKQAALLFVPTRQECYGMVFPEANSFSVPVITTRTGGLSDVVVEGANGHMLPIAATADEYATLIWSIWSDPDRYSRLRKSSWEQFAQRLNWNSWVARASEIIDRVV